MSESTKDFQTLLDTIASGVYGKDVRGAVSYTHLTLPTICSV